MSSLSQAASSVKMHECSLLDSGDVVYRHILQLRRPRYAFFPLPVRKWPRYGLIPWEWAMFSAFSWAYDLGNPCCWSPDRFGSKRVYFWSIFIWSMFTLLQGFVDIFSGFGIIVALFTLRFLAGLPKCADPSRKQSHCCWFPAQEGERRCRFLTPLNTSQR